MYPRNATSPPRIAVGAVVQISDGAVQTSGASATVTPEGGSETAAEGTLACLATSGVWTYIPTQAETNYTAFVVTVYKAGCIPATVTVVTTAVATAGQVNLGAWLGTAPLALASQRVQSDAMAISGDSAAADNLEAAFDGTGYSFLYQQVAREVFGVSGTVWHVATDGNDANDGLSWKTAKLSPKTVIEAASAGDLVVCGPGDFMLGEEGIGLPVGVSLTAPRLGMTRIDSNLVPYTIVPRSNNRISNLTIRNQSDSCGSAPIGMSSEAESCVNIVLDNVRLEATHNGIYVAGTEPCTLRVIDTAIVSGRYLVEVSGGAHQIDFVRSDLRNRTAYSTAQCLFGGGSAKVTFWSSRLCAEADLNTCAIDVTGSVEVNLYDTSIRTYQDIGGDLVARAAQSSIVRLIGCDYDRSKITVSGSGEVIDIARVVTDTSGRVTFSNTVLTTADIDARLAAINLDHLVKVAVDTNWATTVTKNSVVDFLTSKNASQTFDRSTDSGEAIRDQGDASWLTATGFALASLWTEAKAEYLDANVTSRLATVGYTAPDNAGIAAIEAVTDKLDTMIEEIT